MIKIKAYSLLLAFLLTGFLVVQGCSENPAPAKEIAPDFRLRLFNGGSFKLSDYKGKPVLINFLASWCIPCREEIPVLNEAYDEYKPKGVVFLAIAVDDTEENARKFIEEFKLSFPAGLDKSGDIKNAYGLYGVPMTLFIDKEGVIDYLHPGLVTKELLNHELDKLL